MKDDLISRQAAINAVISLCDDCDSGYCGSCRVNYPGEKDAKKVLEALSPAQSEQPTGAQDILQYLDEYLHPIVSPEHWSVYSELYDMVSMLSSARPDWVPVTERLPEDYQDVLVWFEYYRYGSYNRMYSTHGIGTYSKQYDLWMVNHESGWKDLHVIAWMPLPKPYKGGQDGNK